MLLPHNLAGYPFERLCALGLRCLFACLAILAVVAGNYQSSAATPVVDGMRIELQQVYRSGFGTTIAGIPTGLLSRPGGGFLLSENTGTVRIINEGGDTPTGTFLDISSELVPVNSGGRGLLSVSFHPDHLDQSKPGYRKFYTYHVEPQVAGNPGTGADLNNNMGEHLQHNIITEWTINPGYNSVDVSSRREIVRLGHVDGSVHSGGELVFDDDNYLYLPHGTPTAAYSQQLDNTMGTVIRIDPLDPVANVTTDPVSANGAYRIPSDNPFVGQAGAIDEVYAYGMRNPYRLSYDSLTDAMLIGDVGQGSREEVSPLISGGNNGWPRFEGEIDFNTGTVLNPAGPLVEPLASYTRTYGRSVTGGQIYRGSALPELEGEYVFGDLIVGSGSFFSKSGALYYLDPFDGTGQDYADPADVTMKQFVIGFDDRAIGFGPTTFGFDENGELLVSGNSGSREVVFRIVAVPSSELDGDFNNDGVVDAADYTVWRDNLGSNFDLAGNGDESGLSTGVVDQADYDLWRSQFGQSILPAAAEIGSTPVPEPSTFLILSIALGLLRVAKLRN